MLGRSVFVALRPSLMARTVRVFALGVYRKLPRRSVSVLVAPRLLPYTPFFAIQVTLVGDAGRMIRESRGSVILVLMRGSVPVALGRSLPVDECLLPPCVRRAQPRIYAAAMDVSVDYAAILERMWVGALSVDDMVLIIEGSVKVAGQRDLKLVALVLMLLAASPQIRNATPSFAMRSRMPSATVAPVGLRVCVVTIPWKCSVVA